MFYMVGLGYVVTCEVLGLPTTSSTRRKAESITSKIHIFAARDNILGRKWNKERFLTGFLCRRSVWSKVGGKVLNSYRNYLSQLRHQLCSLTFHKHQYSRSRSAGYQSGASIGRTRWADCISKRLAAICFWILHPLFDACWSVACLLKRMPRRDASVDAPVLYFMTCHGQATPPQFFHFRLVEKPPTSPASDKVYIKQLYHAHNHE